MLDLMQAWMITALCAGLFATSLVRSLAFPGQKTVTYSLGMLGMVFGPAWLAVAVHTGSDVALPLSITLGAGLWMVWQSRPSWALLAARHRVVDGHPYVRLAGTAAIVCTGLVGIYKLEEIRAPLGPRYAITFHGLTVDDFEVGDVPTVRFDATVHETVNASVRWAIIPVGRVLPTWEFVRQAGTADPAPRRNYLVPATTSNGVRLRYCGPPGDFRLKYYREERLGLDAVSYPVKVSNSFRIRPGHGCQ